MLQLIATFMTIACSLESREPCLDVHTDTRAQSGANTTPAPRHALPETRTQIQSVTNTMSVPRRAVSCGLGHWAIAHGGRARVMGAQTTINTELIGAVLDVACGRHHTLLLTENGVYASGDNSHGQLGVGSRWAGGAGDAATASGALLRVTHTWGAPLTVLAAGHYHSAAVDANGKLYTWGWGVHGQLGLGGVDDYHTPQLVTKLEGKKVVSAVCGSCHTVVLGECGAVWCSGAGASGQLGCGARDKSAVPVQVRLPDPVIDLAAGYFHNLALSSKGEVWWWGASPQQLRAGHAGHGGPAGHAGHGDADDDAHLTPALLDTGNVRGRIVKIAAGWHHSCIIDNTGSLYTWGLNFDGQLGSGDRKQVKVPTRVVIPAENTESKSQDVNDSDVDTKSLVACGGDFTVFIGDNGRVYCTGNTHLQGNNDLEKLNNRIIMMKTTKRVIKIPAARGHKKFIFQAVDWIDAMLPFDIDDVQREVIQPSLNPLKSIADFNDKSWADKIILLLKPWIDEETLSANQNMSSKLAYHRNKYSDCLKFMLNNLKCEVQPDKLYLSHDLENKSLKNELKIVITNIMSKRIKDISLRILNEEVYPGIDCSVYQSLPCCCDESKYSKHQSPQLLSHPKNLSKDAAKVIDNCIGMFPVESALWEECFRLSKDFYLENDLMMEDLEIILVKYMETNAKTMAAAIMYSNDCSHYSQILSPKFYLNMCSDILDTWG